MKIARQFGMSVLATTVALVGLGCTQARESTMNAEGPQGVFRPAKEREVSATEYRVAPPDKLTLKAPGIKELDNITTQIRPDGKIAVNLLGEIYVANKTPIEISTLLTDAANKYYNNPDVKVEVSEYNSKFYFVMGVSAGGQGKKAYTGRDTVISALADAGLSDDAWPEQIALSRPAKPGQERATAIINLKHIQMTGDMRQNYILEEGDIVFVDDSPLASWRKTTENIAGPIGSGTGAVGGVQSVGPTKK
ncbi:MAG: polysaccharide biosynthesis/export family protein [Phycisphaerae bacterium]|nr:polysaccharide biosynthesis/export family protein [Tepidisphaeraceae bacterium]